MVQDLFEPYSNRILNMMIFSNTRTLHDRVVMMLLISGLTEGYNFSVFSNDGCFSNYSNGRPQEIHMNLSCNPPYLISILTVPFVRLPAPGDEECSDPVSCCNLDYNKICLATLNRQDGLLSDLRGECEKKNNCTTVLNPLYMDHCYLRPKRRCKENLFNQSCWSRKVQVNYACIKEEREFEPWTVAVTDELEENTSSINGGCIAIGLSIPISLIAGIVGTLLYMRYCGAVVKKEKASNTKGNLGSVVSTSHLDHGRPGDQYVDIDVNASYLKSKGVDTSNNKMVGNEKGRSCGTPSEKNALANVDGRGDLGAALEDNPYYEGIVADGTHSSEGMVNAPADVDGGGNPDVSLEDNPHYDGIVADGRHSSEAVDNASAVVDGGGNPGDSLQDNPYYIDTDDNEHTSNDTQQKYSAGNQKEGNYVYTYGHFSMEGRQREPDSCGN